MYKDSFETESTWQRIARILSASFRLGRFFGVELRVYWITLILLPLILVSQLTSAGYTFAEAVGLSALIAGILYAVVYTHEMGHVLAGRRYRIHTGLITLSPLGGIAHMSSPAAEPKQEILISLAGPATHLVWLAIFWPLSLLVEPNYQSSGSFVTFCLQMAVHQLVQINLWLMLFNLIPVFPLDGGRVLRALLALKMPAKKATIIACRIGMVGGVAFAIASFTLPGTWSVILFLIGISAIQACWHEMEAMKRCAGPYQTSGFEAWQQDPDAWKYGMSEQSEKPGLLARLKTKREAKRAAAEHERRASLDSQMDKVLEKISEVGITGLSASERKILDRSSKERRKTGS